MSQEQAARSNPDKQARDEASVSVQLPTDPTDIEIVANPQRLISQVRPSAADQHPAAVYLSHLAPGSRRTMRGALDTMAGLLTANHFNMQTLDWSALRYQHTTALRTLLADLYAPATANKMLAALRGVLQESWRLGKMSAEEFRRAADLPTVRGSTLPRGRAVSRPELVALFEVCAKDKGPAGRRDAAILAVLYNCGLRRSELVALDVADYDPEESAVTVQSGKGRKARISYATDVSQRAIQEWLQLRTSTPGPLFTPINKAGKITLRRLSDQAVRKLLLKRAAEAGVAHFSPHDLRRTMISDLLDAGADISTVQRLAGHANVTTTARYDRRGETVKRRAANLLNVPLTKDDR